MHLSSKNWHIGTHRWRFLLMVACIMVGIGLRLVRFSSRSREAALRKFNKLFVFNRFETTEIYFVVNEFSVGLSKPEISLIGKTSEPVSRVTLFSSLLSLRPLRKSLELTGGRSTGNPALEVVIPLKDLPEMQDSWILISFVSGQQAAFVLPWHIELSDYDKWLKRETLNSPNFAPMSKKHSQFSFAVLWWNPCAQNDLQAERQIVNLAEEFEIHSVSIASNSPPSNQLNLRNSKISWITASSAREAAERFNEELQGTKASHIITIQGSILLRQHFLRVITETLNNGQEDHVLYFDHDFLIGNRRTLPQFKPGFGLETFQTASYLGPVIVFPGNALKNLSGFEPNLISSFIDDAIFKCAEQRIAVSRIPQIIYHQIEDNSGMRVERKDREICLRNHFHRRNISADIKPGKLPGTSIINAKPKDSAALISILIPTSDHSDDLKKCVDSILQKSTWKNYEIIILENNSKKIETFSLYRELEQDKRIRIVDWQKPFNYSAINNYGAKLAHGEILLFLNNDIEVISPDWLESLAFYAEQTEIGAVGARLLYPDSDLQHGGVVLGIGGVAGHVHSGIAYEAIGYLGRLSYTQNVSAVTGACLMMRRDVFKQVDGFDEGFAVAFNDVDLCCKILSQNLRIVQVQHVELFHFESRSRGAEDTPEKKARFIGEIDRFKKKWSQKLSTGDSFFNPNLSLDSTDCSLNAKTVN